MKELILPRIAIDTREQLRYQFDGFESYRTTLATGDYSLEGYESVLAVERKNHSDAWGCLTEGRKRFERCLERLSMLDRAAIVIESSMAEFVIPPPQVKRVNAATAMGSYISWSTKWRIPVFFAENRQWGERVTLRILAAYYKHCAGGVAVAIERARVEAQLQELAG
jgi:ERCC4-type nuclease